MSQSATLNEAQIANLRSVLLDCCQEGWSSESYEAEVNALCDMALDALSSETPAIPEGVLFAQWWDKQDHGLGPAHKLSAWNGWIARAMLAASPTNEDSK